MRYRNRKLKLSLAILAFLYAILLTGTKIFITDANFYFYKFPKKIIEVKLDEIPDINYSKEVIIKDPIERITKQISPKIFTEDPILFIPETLIRETRLFFHFNNIYISAYGVIKDEKYFHIVPSYSKDKITYKKGEECYRKAIVGFSHHTEFGHFICDMLSALLLIPGNYFEDGIILVNFDIKNARNYMKYLNFDESKIFELTKEWTYVSECHILVAKEGVNALLVEGLPLVRKKFFENLHLNEIKPSKFNFLNRKLGLWGRLNNIDELINAAKVKYKGKYEFGQIGDEVVYNVAAISKLLAETKFLITCPGSMVMNTIFMHENTYILICGHRRLDAPNIGVCYSLNIYMIYADGDLPYKTLVSHPFPVHTFTFALEQMIYMIENGKWSEKVLEKYKYTYNIEELKSKL